VSGFRLITIGTATAMFGAILSQSFAGEPREFNLRLQNSIPVATDLSELSKLGSVTLKPSPSETIHERWYFDHVTACSAVLRHARTDDRQATLDGEPLREISELRENYPLQFSKLERIETGTDAQGNPFLLITAPLADIWVHSARTAKLGWQDPAFTDSPPKTIQSLILVNMRFSGANQDSMSTANGMASILHAARAQCTGNAYMDQNWLDENLEIDKTPLEASSTTKTIEQLRAELSNYLSTYTDKWEFLNDADISAIKSAFRAPGGPAIDNSYLESPTCTLWLRGTDTVLSLNIIRLVDLIPPGVGQSDDPYTEMAPKANGNQIYILDFPPIGAPYQPHVEGLHTLILRFSSAKIRRKFDEDMFFLIKKCQEPLQAAP